MGFCLRDAVWLVPLAGLVVFAEVWPAYRTYVWWGIIGAVTILIGTRITLLVKRLRKPLNYRLLHVSASGIEYENLSRQRWSIPWTQIASITFYRGEAPYAQALSETMWLIRRHTATGFENVQMADEHSNRRLLVNAFTKYLPGFDSEQLRRALDTRKHGHWMCLPSPNNALNTDAPTARAG